jgi:hypothetical protein
MIPPATDRGVLRCALARIAQLAGTYDSKTDQTAQTDQRFDIADEFGALLGLELTSYDRKLTSGTVQPSNPALHDLNIPTVSARGRPSHGAPSP